ncbi:MAG: HTTM domain-containing protein [Bdellovibrionota bacterium]|nr:MAG: HTTM domain-containing protein [Bdellovibrionota bacterium]
MTQRLPFILFRITFGSFLIWHWIQLSPFMEDLYSVDGLYAHRFEAPWPNVLNSLHGQLQLGVFNALAIALSFFVLCGILRRGSALLLSYLHGCVVSWNVMLSPPSDGYVGWLLIALVLIPSGEGLGLHRRTEHWRMPREIMMAGMVVLGVTYTLSGLDKLRSELWWSGDALRLLFEGPLVRAGIAGELVRSLPMPLLTALTWGSVAAETLFLPLIFWRPTRVVAWSAMTLMHFGVLMTVSITTVSIAMLCFHFFVWPTLLREPIEPVGQPDHQAAV